MITLSQGLKNSLIVLEHLRDNTDLKDINIIIGTFTNCRECGLTFLMSEGNKAFTWCVYEHRNSDSIIINGKEGYISCAGELPYIADSKWEYLAEFKYNEHYECAIKLAEMFTEFYTNNQKNKNKRG